VIAESQGCKHQATADIYPPLAVKAQTEPPEGSINRIQATGDTGARPV
jgi:hypothetical protein